MARLAIYYIHGGQPRVSPLTNIRVQKATRNWFNGGLVIVKCVSVNVEGTKDTVQLNTN